MRVPDINTLLFYVIAACTVAIVIKGLMSPKSVKAFGYWLIALSEGIEYLQREVPAVSRGFLQGLRIRTEELRQVGNRRAGLEREA